MKSTFQKYSHIWTAAYALLYMPWFLWLEKTVVSDYTAIHISLDDKIPFCEYFIIPYYLWFGYVAFGFIFLFLTSRKDYYQLCMFLFSGMTVFLIICTIFPNGQNLRLEIPRDNFFSSLVESLYQTDTNTNVFPSIHVFNSVGIMIGLRRSTWLKDAPYRKLIYGCSWLLGISIICSTVLLKQHSLVDVIGAFALSIILYYIVYVPRWKFLEHVKPAPLSKTE